ncbi:MAG: phosphoribosylglycinamide synthetase C domain-containing protein, partial [bacterium]
GYPASSQKGVPIQGLEKASELPDVIVYHAGTKEENGRVVTNGGRVLGVTGIGDNLHDARKNAYAAVDMISFAGAQYRKDIGVKALE